MKRTHLYCKNCGSKLKPGTESCPMCGTRANPEGDTRLRTAKMPLFDHRHRDYITKPGDKQLELGIIDQDDTTIGLMRLYPPSGRWDFLETDGTTVSAIVEPKKDLINIRDGEGRLLGRARIKGSIRPVAYLEDAEGKGMCEIKCYKWASPSWKYNAHDPKGQLVAEIDRVSGRKQSFAVAVHGDSIDRRLLVPFTFVIMAFVRGRRAKPSAIGWFAGGFP